MFTFFGDIKLLERLFRGTNLCCNDSAGLVHGVMHECSNRQFLPEVALSSFMMIHSPCGVISFNCICACMNGRKVTFGIIVPSASEKGFRSPVPKHM